LKRSKGIVVGGITYIEATKPAGLFLRLLVKLRIVSAPVHKIKPRSTVAGPVLYLSSIRNDKGEVISLDVYHHILALRAQITDHFFHLFKSFYFVKKQKKMNTLYGYFSLRVAKDIAPAVYFANFARWKGWEQDTKESSANVLVIPESDWSTMVAADLENVVDRVVIDKRDKSLFWKIKVLTRLLAVFSKLGPRLCFRLLKRDASGVLADLTYRFPLEQNKPNQVMVPYAMGLFKDQRTDISYYHASDLGPQQLLIFVRSPGHVPTAAELEWLTENRVSCVKDSSVTNALPGIPMWTSSPALKPIKREFYGLYVKTAAQCVKNRKPHSWWLLDRLWDMGMEVAYWKDFFLGNHIAVIVNLSPSEYNFIPCAAIADIGGIAVECERSIRFDYCTYIHNAPNHINFISGTYSLTQIPEPSFSLFTIQSSSINVGDDHIDIEGLAAIDSSKFIAAVFDETANDVFFGDSIRQLYQAMLDLLKSDERFVLLIKTKKPQILEKLDHIYDEVIHYSERGRCLVTDWKVTATNAAIHADVVVSVPSTAMFESVLAGARTIVFNPMRSGSKIFYSNNGLNRRIFEDPQTMLAAIKRFAEGNDDTVGDCRDIALKVDGFRDGQGARRVGNYLKWCLEGLDAGIQQDEVIQAANRRYSEQWGEDRITDRNSFETQCAPAFYAENRKQ
jgi:hypothetical protein